MRNCTRFASGNACVALSEIPLDSDRAGQGMGYRGKIGQHRIAGVVLDRPVVRLNCSREGVQIGAESAVRALFVFAGQAAVTGYVGVEDRREFMLERCGFHGCAFSGGLHDRVTFPFGSVRKVY